MLTTEEVKSKKAQAALGVPNFLIYRNTSAKSGNIHQEGQPTPLAKPRIPWGRPNTPGRWQAGREIQKFAEKPK
jgi:hypothetical protein